MFFKKREAAEFEATKKFSDYLQYDESRGLVKIKGCKDLISVDQITGYELKYGNKVYNKKNLGTAIAAGALFGVLGIMATGTHEEEYVSNIGITVIANGKHHYIPLTIGKMKMSAAKGILNMAENIVGFLNEITE